MIVVDDANGELEFVETITYSAMPDHYGYHSEQQGYQHYEKSTFKIFFSGKNPDGKYEKHYLEPCAAYEIFYGQKQLLRKCCGNQEPHKLQH